MTEVEWEDEEDRALYQRMVVEARIFLGSFRWCGGIRQMWIGLAVPGVVAVFFIEIVPAGADADDFLWVVVGDLPPAHLAPDEAVDSTEALRRYIEEMRRWVRAVRAGEPVDELIPVNVKHTAEFAEMLATRLDSLERKVVES